MRWCGLDTKLFALCIRVLVITELVVSEIQCNNHRGQGSSTVQWKQDLVTPNNGNNDFLQWRIQYASIGKDFLFSKAS